MTFAGNRIVLLLRAAVLLAMLGVLLAAPTVARAAVAPPHVLEGNDNQDVCAMCHRTHTAVGNATYRAGGNGETAGSALLVSPTGDKGDAGFCYTCHGAEAIGANTDVQSSFEATSHHSLEPSASPYGPTPKQCSDCHDSHGTAKTPSGAPYPALLRSFSTTGPVYTGEEYCANCHKVRAGSSFDGLDVFRKTAHYSQLPTPTTGTDIRCDICHQPHGSKVAPLIASQITPPAVAATVAIAANDRTLCFACHPNASATYPGEAAYQASAHGQTAATVTIGGEWASKDATRAAGECQNCHDPMGRSDGKGGVIPKLADKAATALCLTCHTLKGAASTDFAKLSYPSTATPTEIVAGWSPATSTVAYSRISLYSQDATTTLPHALVGPREYRAPEVGTGRIAAGDVDGDGSAEIVAAVPGKAQLAVFRRDPLRGISLVSSALGISFPADFVAVGDFLGDDSQQIAAVSSSGKLRLYTYDGALSPATGEIALDAGISSLAVGDVTGTASPDLVASSRDADLLDVVTESGGTLAKTGAFPTGSKPTGVSVGDIWPEGGKSEICVVSGFGPGQLSVFDGDGTDKADYVLPGTAESSPTASAIGDLLTDSARPGAEVAVAIATATGDSTVAIFPRLPGGGLAVPQEYRTDSRANSGSLAIGDVDGDGKRELVVGNAGRWAVDADRQVPSLQVFRGAADGLTLDTTPRTLVAGGVELAGSAPSLAITDLGAGPSRHPWGAVPGSHVSTETKDFGTRHVECVDCHEVHESTSTAGVAPNAYGAIKGATGVSVDNLADGSVQLTYEPSVRFEYELCFKCHSAWPADLQGREDLPMDFNTRNRSLHGVEDTHATTIDDATLVSPWKNDSVLYCKDCHDTDASADAKGPHASGDAPILAKPYLGTTAQDAGGLCYKCHRQAAYYDGTVTGSRFTTMKSGVPVQLHAEHTNANGIGCQACHVSHGSTTEPALLGAAVGYGGVAGVPTSCDNGCHPGGITYAP